MKRRKSHVESIRSFRVAGGCHARIRERYAADVLTFLMMCAVSLQAAADILPTLPEYEYQLGLTLKDASPYIVVATVKPGSPADIAGIRAEDQVIAVDGQYTGLKVDEKSIEIDEGCVVQSPSFFAGRRAPIGFVTRVVNTGPKDSSARSIILRDQSHILVVDAIRSLRID